MKIKQYDKVKLKDNRVGFVVEVFSSKDFLLEIPPQENGEWLISITIDDIDEILRS